MHLGLALEYSLGHVTHAQNLQQQLDGVAAVTRVPSGGSAYPGSVATGASARASGPASISNAINPSCRGCSSIPK
ncbi:MAG: hypothetical protein RLZZ78_700 [Armatimonadota bacterium]